MQRRVIVVALATFLAVSILGMLVGAAGAQPTKLYFVFGYYPVDFPGDTAAFDSLSRWERVDAVGAFLFQIDEFGNVIGQSDPKLMELARARNLSVEAVIHNYRGGFDRGIATAVLTDPAVQARALDSIERLLKTQGYHGVQIDLENVDPLHRPQLTEFMRRVAQRLRPQGFTVSIAVPAKTWDDPNNGWSGAFDYRALGQIVDAVSLMTYDEHWAGAPPGPIASLPWVRDVVRYASQVIPKDKVLVGVAGYGYDWPAAGGMGQMIKGRDAPTLAVQKGVQLLWDDQAQVPYFRYTQGGQMHVVYFENPESTRQKLNLVVENQLGGIALWRLGFEDPGVWPVVEELLGSRGPRRGPPPTEPPGQQPPPGQEPPPGHEPPPGQPPRQTTYVVQPGDTLYLIGQRFGLAWEAIAAANPGINPWWILPGERLVIPTGGGAGPGQPPGGTPGQQPPSGQPPGQQPPQQTAYVVRPGDTLYLIGQRFGLPWEAIAAANPGINPWWILPGERLVIPAGGGAGPGQPPGGTPGQQPPSGQPPGQQPPQQTAYVVRPGDTLYLIGQRFGLTWEAIAAVNPGINPWWILPGQRLVIPGR